MRMPGSGSPRSPDCPWARPANVLRKAVDGRWLPPPQPSARRMLTWPGYSLQPVAPSDTPKASGPAGSSRRCGHYSPDAAGEWEWWARSAADQASRMSPMAWQARGQSDMILLTAPRACWPALSTGCDMWAGSWAVQSWLCWGTVARLAASVCSFCRWIRDGRGRPGHTVWFPGISGEACRSCSLYV